MTVCPRTHLLRWVVDTILADRPAVEAELTAGARQVVTTGSPTPIPAVTARRVLDAYQAGEVARWGEIAEQVGVTPQQVADIALFNEQLTLV